MTETAEPALLPAEPGYRHVLRLRWALTLLPVLVGAIAFDLLIVPELGMASGIVTGLALLLILWTLWRTPARQFAMLGHALGDDALRVVRGYLFHTDTIVPFVRVQHIDVGQGPVERIFGVAHVVVHTAGTHNSVVTLPGVDPATAHAMRDTIRAHISTDFA